MKKNGKGVVPNGVLLTGGTGLVGSKLRILLRQNNSKVHVLSRNPAKVSSDSGFFWNPDTDEIDAKCLDGISTVIHLAGAGVADKRWSSKRREEIIGSRVKSTELLFKTLKNNTNHVDTIIAASAVGIYGDRGDSWLNEETKPGSGFLSETTQKWEESTSKLSDQDIRLVTLRIGIVLSTNGGALPEISKSIKFNIEGIPGSGKQFYPWIHLDDLCQMILFGIKTESVNGIYNASGPNPVTCLELTHAISEALGKRVLRIHAPALFLKLAMGEMSSLVLNSNRVSSDKIRDAGFQFEYNSVREAMFALFRN